MDIFFNGLSMAFPRVLDHSLEVSILICLIFLVKLLAPKKLPSWWHYSLWLLLLVRMLVPMEFENQLNVFNFIPAPATHQISEIILESPPESPGIFPAAEPGSLAGRLDIQFLIIKAMPVVWLIGAMILGVCVLFETFSFWLNVRRKPKVIDEDVLALLSECKSRMRIKRNIPIVVTDNVRSPGLFGYLRPRLLLPEGVFEKLSDRELSYAFMHELGHLKRHDIGVSWLIAVLQVIHWFNPLVWLAFHQIRIDQESACDAAVLSRMKTRYSADYAKAIVGFLEKFCHNCQLPALAGVLENRSQMRKRITRIVQYRKSSQKLSLTTAILLVFAGCLLFSLTGVAAKKEDPVSSATADDAISFDSEPIVMGNRPDDADMTNRLTLEWEFSSVVQHDNPVVDVDHGPIMSTERPAASHGIQTPGISVSGRMEASDFATLEKSEPASAAPRNVETPVESLSADASENRQVHTGDMTVRMTSEQKQTPIIEEGLQTFQVAVKEGSFAQEAQTGNHADPGEGDGHAMSNNRQSFQSDILPGPDHRESERDRLNEPVVAADKEMAEMPVEKTLQRGPAAALLTAEQENNDSREFQAAEVYMPPRLVKAYPPRYPYIAKRDDITGSITLQFVVNKEGYAVNTTVLESYPEGVFDDAALQAVEKYRFKPGTKDGKAVDVRVSLPIKFNLT